MRLRRVASLLLSSTLIMRQKTKTTLLVREFCAIGHNCLSEPRALFLIRHKHKFGIAD